MTDPGGHGASFAPMRRAAALVCAAALVASACGGDDDDEPSLSATTTTAPTGTVDLPPDAGPLADIELTLTEVATSGPMRDAFGRKEDGRSP